MEESTILAVGLAGNGFVLVGRTCVRGKRGALWNEWTLRHADGRLTYLVEAVSRFTLYEELTTRSEATRVATWGEVPSAPPVFRFADIAAPRVSIDFTAEHVFVGRPATLAELGLTPVRAHPRLLAAPDVSRPKGVEPWLAVGDEGPLGKILGMVSRRAGDASWDEYLVHDASVGPRWLVLADGAFSLATEAEGGSEASGEPKIASIEWATGELPWDVRIGETSWIQEFAGGLTKEWSDDAVTWSKSEALTTDAVARAFGRRALPRSRAEGTKTET